MSNMFFFQDMDHLTFVYYSSDNYQHSTHPKADNPAGRLIKDARLNPKLLQGLAN